MKALLYKEFKIAIAPALFLFFLLGFLAIIPQYPSIVSVFYVFCPIFVFSSLCKENKDMDFMIILPVSRDDIVKTREVVVFIFEAAQLAVAAICAVIVNLLISPNGNIVGLDLNPAFFGIAMLGYGLFNVLYLPLFFKTAHKAGLPILYGVIAAVLVYAGFEMAIALVPALKASLDVLNPAMLPYQFIVFAVGLLSWLGLSYLSYKLSCRNFSKVNV